jgi:anti-sigma B factor antagonist
MHGVQVERVRTAAVVRATGELDAFAEPDLKAAFDEVTGSDKVVADLEPVSFMDSTALGLVVRVVRELTEGGTATRVVLPSGVARRIFALTGLDGILPVSHSLAAALRELDA